MQTFLPYPDFRKSAATLDTARLGKQRVEALHVLRALVVPEYGWTDHPAVRMWMGHVPALTLYALATVDEWTDRGHPDNTRANITEFAPQAAHPDYASKIPLPYWLGNESFHLSHQSKLLRKEPKFYTGVFDDNIADLDFVWPEPKHEFIPEDPREDFLWILRNPHPEFTPETLTTVGMPAVHNKAVAAAVEADGYAPVYVQDDSRRPTRQAKKIPRPKEKKPTRRRQVQDQQFTTLPGNTDVAVPFDDGAKFALGTVHGRPITLEDGRFGRNFTLKEVIERSAFDSPALLQDSRVFFPVPAP
ncbi:MSMEG_6728 family protein [Pseudarthrobacter sp. PS3-L1]|uniref:MSMEG_6728 family protein n=1 Tax=Pseudarthrobacter sp. PS3-L1 TaxID=3046207 RepID=UPI0024BA4C32|nr:MSMEG_6728 family protein [Pseudarthrobacter sp. PS3-L1]MDJ0319448.1 MSMEG_6728 family protein [Pseudarthrobacter sp. PS3-L1]